MLLRLIETIHPKETRWLGECGVCNSTVLDPTQVDAMHVICPVCMTETPFQITTAWGLLGNGAGLVGRLDL